MLDKQLIADCHILGKLNTSFLLLSKNAALPWFILVPDTEVQDLLDLDEASLQAVNLQAKQVSAFIKNELSYKKINVASLGNIVAQLHIHIIGRSSEDPCWPAPVWGNLNVNKSYSEADLAKLKAKLLENYGLKAL